VTGNPVAIFVVASAIFGSAIILVAPPLRGPDETAHFLRAYGIAQGDFIPSIMDEAARKGVLLPHVLYRDFRLFDMWQETGRREGISLSQLIDQFRQPRLPQSEGMRPPVFVAYAGSEGYSPAAYLPHAAAALLAQVAGLEFLPTFYLMRAAGFAMMTAVVAYAIAVAPVLKWTFVAIAMLPSALNGRAVISADGAAFAYALLVIAIFLRGASGLPATPAWRHSALMTLCTLAKPPNLAFLLLQWLRPDVLRGAARSLLVAAIITVPAVVAAVVWTTATSADVAAWRLELLTGTSAQEFDPAWKLRFMVAHPTDFPAAVLSMLRTIDPGEFLRQLIGVLGLFDTVLRPWLYTAITVLLAALLVLPSEAVPHRHAAWMALSVALGYSITVVLIMYLVWTPVRAETVWGVQGRYFVPILPLIPVVTATLVRSGGITLPWHRSSTNDVGLADRRLTPRVSTELASVLAIAAAALSGVGSVDAILRTDWDF
jgi:uncharacterized membrane protein